MYWIDAIHESGILSYSLKKAIYSDRLPIDIAVDSVKRISERYPPPYTLFASGGVDSQACIYAWIKSGVEFKVIFVRYENNFNDHDFIELQAFREKYNFQLEILEFNVIDFLTTDLEKYVLTYNCISPMICTHFAMSEMITNGTVVFSGNYALPNNSKLSFVETAWLNYRITSRRNIVPCFFFEDPELVFSFTDIHAQTELEIVNHPDYDPLLKLYDRPVWSYKIKYLTYQKAGFPVIPQEIKLSGFEKIKDHCDQQFPVTVKELLKYGSMHSKRSFEIKFRYPWIKLVNEPLPRVVY
jgi:hypothetical protein